MELIREGDVLSFYLLPAIHSQGQAANGILHIFFAVAMEYSSRSVLDFSHLPRMCASILSGRKGARGGCFLNWEWHICFPSRKICWPECWVEDFLYNEYDDYACLVLQALASIYVQCTEYGEVDSCRLLLFKERIATPQNCAPCLQWLEPLPFKPTNLHWAFKALKSNDCNGKRTSGCLSSHSSKMHVVRPARE